jgi:hypothetical protein
MSQKLINLNPDLKQLRDEGYFIEIRGSYLLVKEVPYVNSNKEVKRGILASSLNLAGDITQRPDDHRALFVGDCPCRQDGSSMVNELVSQSIETKLYEGLTANYWFSRKPPRGYYENYYEKMTTYFQFISSHAEAIDPCLKARIYRVDEPEDENSPFNYLDTASSRADINIVTGKLALDKIAIVGLGGTGSYILDLIAKTPVKEIHIFDGDVYSTHNAFRSPSAPSIDELREQQLKSTYFRTLYSKMHRGIIAHDIYIDASNVDELQNMNFVFLSFDKNGPKRLIIDKLEERNIPFIDVGMGLTLKNDMLDGILRVTTSTADQRQHVKEKRRIPLDEVDDNNEYDTNIQIADLNALNAVLAVIKWKKLFGFYVDLEKEFFSTYTIGCNMLISEDTL